MRLESIEKPADIFSVQQHFCVEKSSNTEKSAFAYLHYLRPRCCLTHAQYVVSLAEVHHLRPRECSRSPLVNSCLLTIFESKQGRRCRRRRRRNKCFEKKKFWKFPSVKCWKKRRKKKEEALSFFLFSSSHLLMIACLYACAAERKIIVPPETISCAIILAACHRVRERERERERDEKR